MTGRQNQGGTESRQEAEQDRHQSLHSEAGGLAEHPGQPRNPVIKVAALAWLEFEKPDLDHAAGSKEASSA